MKKKLLIAAVMATSLTATANTDGLEIKTARMAGPFSVAKPLVIDSTSVDQKKYSEDNIINTPLSMSVTDGKEDTDLNTWTTTKGTLNVAAFDVNSTSYVKAKVDVKGAKQTKVFVDGKEVNGEAALQPGIHKVAVKFVADSTGVALSLTGDSTKLCAVKPATYGTFNMRTNLETRVTRSAELSASGRWAIMSYSWYDETNKTQWRTVLKDLTTNREMKVEKAKGWLPRSERYYYTEDVGGKTNLIAVDPASGKSTVMAHDLPSGGFVIAPTEEYLIIYKQTEGPKKETGVFEITHPDDRQPGWRDRNTLLRYDLATGFTQPLTYGYHNCYVSDISNDGRYLLLMVRTDSVGRPRPFDRSTFMRMDVRTLAVDTLVHEDGFIASGEFMNSSDDIVFMASPEAFGGIGNIVPEGMTPSNFDYHLYHLNCKTKVVTPLTTRDNTTISSFAVNHSDNSIVYTAERADSVLLYRLAPFADKRKAINCKSQLIAQPLEDISGFDLATSGGNVIVHGTSACVPYRVYNINISQALSHKAGAAKLLLDPNAELYANVKLGTCKPWKFTCKRGYEVSGHYYLPANFDPAKKYPVIVHYYGGCSPTSRRFGNGSHYPAHYWNAQGYITFIVNPSGATGFGQEWAARHVNTMGEGVVQDIIEATEQFCKDVPQVDKDHIGCVSASYGGFMTQNILIHTDMFACGISHAGISDHTSYWGEGYWGYSYSQTSAANTYPWTRKDLYVDRSPLYNADKIHKPLLFTHGTADTNVPIGESIQMYTALKLLGRPTAFIQVEGENHGIMDPVKRTVWIDSMLAWFQKWLKDDSSWWDAIYQKKEL